MRVVVFGPHGMLGRAVCSELTARGHSITGVSRYQCNILNGDALRFFCARGSVVVNCVGVIPCKAKSALDTIAANALFPHILARYSSKLIHISTDCVFSGTRLVGYNYGTEDTTDAVDLYGRSKALGEVVESNVTNIRTSFIGFNHGLLHWLISNSGKSIDGWLHAMWSGSTVYAVARGVVAILESGCDTSVIHLATPSSLSKYNAIVLLNNALNLGLEILPQYRPVINRALASTWPLTSLEQSMDQLKEVYYKDMVGV